MKVWLVISKKQKIRTKKDYDKRNKVAVPQWTVGQQVLLEDKRAKIRRHRIVSHRRFDNGPWYISDIYKGEGVGPGYRLVSVNSGKPYRQLVSGDRLKLYRNDRTDLDRYPRVLLPSNESVKEEGISNKNKTKQLKEEAIKVLRQNGPHKFYVLFADGTKDWSTDISSLLLEEWRLEQDRARL